MWPITSTHLSPSSNGIRIVLKSDAGFYFSNIEPSIKSSGSLIIFGLTNTMNSIHPCHHHRFRASKLSLGKF